MANILIKAKDLCKSYANEGLQNHVLNNIDLEIIENDFTVIMGSSGSGKSTLLYCLSGMDTFSSGEVYFKEASIHNMKTDELSMLRRKHIGFVFQQMHLVSNLSLFENIVVPGYLLKKYKPKEVNKRAKELLKSVGLLEAQKRLPSQVSGGEQQRASIARGLINEPSLIFADEPTGALNSKARNEVLDLLTKVNEKGQSILMVTHDIKAAIRANRIMYIEDGKVVGDMSMKPYTEEEKKSRETQVLSWLSSKGW
ncbi:ABC transporter ATP-binding protein [Clostridium gasigenes]|uniref:ABC transporter ATP-binding protein n=1 Tax=Clostridium gasigenes TaxID=94869 RepID=UPI001438678B|nr:ABC transporter ATP-binding protein [Clostridium gasigenes]NKF07169.1 ABC transporter ATP-binding protein [Clostridium gasigenes]QSW18152.1 ABC transporter ATP-binding protein [Clostridium gasigenes]